MTLATIETTPEEGDKGASRMLDAMSRPFGAIVLSLRDDGTGYNIEVYRGRMKSDNGAEELAMFDHVVSGAAYLMGNTEPELLLALGGFMDTKPAEGEEFDTTPYASAIIMPEAIN